MRASNAACSAAARVDMSGSWVMILVDSSLGAGLLGVMGLDSSAAAAVDLGVLALETVVPLAEVWVCANGDSGGVVPAAVAVLLRSNSAGCCKGGSVTSRDLPDAAMLCTHMQRP